jgi:pimeloyl-ACP methyl ester carboxylesterase
VAVEGGSLEYLDIPARGSHGMQLLLLHEGLGSVSMWRDFPDALAAATGARVVAYSRLGFGRSSPRKAPYGLRFMHEEAAQVVPRVRATLGLDLPVLIGHSTGASMALLHAAHDPGSVAGVVAIAPLIDVEGSNVDSIEAAREQWRTTAWREKLARHHDDVDAVFSAWNDTWLDPAFRRWSITADLASVRCPVLAILGADDPYSTPRQLELLENAASRACVQRLLLASCGHSPHREMPGAVTRAIGGFLNSCGNTRFER